MRREYKLYVNKKALCFIALFKDHNTPFLMFLIIIHQIIQNEAQWVNF